MRRIILGAVGSLIGLALGVTSAVKQNKPIDVSYADKVVFLDNEVTAVEEPTGQSAECYSFVEKDEKICIGTYKVTAYCPCEKCCGVWARIRGNNPVYGASGQLLIEGESIAVDPSIIEYGTTVYIQGKAYTASDCGVKGNKIDMYMNSHEDALEWGVKYIDIYVDKND